MLLAVLGLCEYNAYRAYTVKDSKLEPGYRRPLDRYAWKQWLSRVLIHNPMVAARPRHGPTLLVDHALQLHNTVTSMGKKHSLCESCLKHGIRTQASFQCKCSKVLCYPVKSMACYLEHLARHVDASEWQKWVGN